MSVGGWDATVDALIEALHAKCHHTLGYGRQEGIEAKDCGLLYYHRADANLVAPLVATIRAEAYDEGFAAGRDVGRDEGAERHYVFGRTDRRWTDPK